MKCVKCKVRESTGITIALCDECFDEFEKAVKGGDASAAPLAVAAFVPPEGYRVATVRAPDGDQYAVLVEEKRP